MSLTKSIAPPPAPHRDAGFVEARIDLIDVNRGKQRVEDRGCCSCRQGCAGACKGSSSPTWAGACHAAALPERGCTAIRFSNARSVTSVLPAHIAAADKVGGKLEVNC